MNQIENKINLDQTTDIPDRLIFLASKILMLQNIAIFGSYLLFRLIGGSIIDPPWLKRPGQSEQTSIIFIADLLGFSLLILTFLVVGIKEKNDSLLWIAGGITGWLIPRLYWQFIHKESLLPNWAYGKIRFLFSLSYEYAENVTTVYLFFLSALIPYLLIKNVKHTNLIGNDLFQYYRIHFYAGLILVLPHLFITSFLLRFPVVMGIMLSIVLLLKFYMIILGYAIFRNFYKRYKLPNNTQNP